MLVLVPWIMYVYTEALSIVVYNVIDSSSLDKVVVDCKWNEIVLCNYYVVLVLVDGTML